MPQRIARVTSAAGTEVAYASLGADRPVVYVAGWLGHLELSWTSPQERAFFEELAAGCRLIRYDRAGTGLSSASAPSATLASELDQLDAVVATLGDEPFDLIGVSLGALVAVSWAARHPDRVRRLVFYGGWVSGPTLRASAHEFATADGVDRPFLTSALLDPFRSGDAFPLIGSRPDGDVLFDPQWTSAPAEAFLVVDLKSASLST